VSPHSPAALPLEARQAAWSRLWQRLLADPPPRPEPKTEPGGTGDEPTDAAK